ncbi:MCE family protein [Acidisoma cellulosilytica]|uniref:MCE family protein n=1 Tax=Acidisoma cellulosilyticum TaxID=2802395 RepID=A0A963YZ74_9PROT|nr:MlaD family protein [Acidisoma cellulosilyticum]MCB8879907.1 MCE family protein [Acidisoma cellulosilyticum]
MSDMSSQIPSAAVQKKGRKRVSLIWGIPVITVLIGGWLVWDTYSKRGPLISITFDQGMGLTAGQSVVKHRDVTLGTVTSVKLTPDMNHVVVKIQMTRDATPLISDKTKFWIVRPRFFAGSLSGLGTLLSGPFIDLLPSPDAGKPQTTFVGLEDPPVLQSVVPGRNFVLQADHIGSVSLGAPIFYRDLQVGQILGWDIGDMAKSVTIHAFVRAPYDAYVHADSRFWNASGLAVKLGADGVQVKIQSLDALLLGGIAFSTSDDDATGTEAKSGTSFPLYDSQDAADQASYDRRVPFVAYFLGSVAGLGPGSPVTFQGLRIGEVKSVDMEYDGATNTVRAPVRFEVQPQRIKNINTVAARGPLANVQQLVASGLRAQIQKSNFLTGQSEISLVILPNAPKASVTFQNNEIVFPTSSGAFDSITTSVTTLLAKINNMPFDQMSASLTSALAGLSNLTNGQQTKQAVASLAGTLAASQDLVKNLNAEAGPALKSLPALAKQLKAASGNLNLLLVSANSAYGGDSHFSRQLEQLMTQLNDMAQSFRALSDLLTSHPEALIRGRANSGVEQ